MMRPSYSLVEGHGELVRCSGKKLVDRGAIIYGSNWDSFVFYPGMLVDRTLCMCS